MFYIGIKIESDRIKFGMVFTNDFSVGDTLSD